MGEFPDRVQKTGYGWDESQSSYKVQIGTHDRTIGYSWVPASLNGEEAAHATEIANRLCEGWNWWHDPARKAAPELIEALQALLIFAEVAETKMLVGDEGCLWPVEQARAALAKALGDDG